MRGRTYEFSERVMLRGVMVDVEVSCFVYRGSTAGGGDDPDIGEDLAVKTGDTDITDQLSEEQQDRLIDRAIAQAWEDVGCEYD